MKLIFSYLFLVLSVSVFGQTKGNENLPKPGEVKIDPSSTVQSDNNSPLVKLSMTGSETNSNPSTTVVKEVVLPQKPAPISVEKIDPKDQPK